MKLVIEVEDKATARSIAESIRDCAKNTEDEQKSRDLYDVALQFAGIASHMDLGPKLPNVRHASQEGTRLVATQMNALTNAKVFVDHDPASDAERERGVGDWNICYQNGRELDSAASYRMSSCERMATILVLADALRKHDPHHPLFRTWYLREENREKLPKYYV